MHLPLSWLKEFVKLDATPEKIAEKLTLSGSEVEKMIRHDDGLSKVVVGEIKDVKPHPNADKLQLAHVTTGKAKNLEIVCGAKNIKPGQKVPVVLLGGTVPGLTIEPREIRGVKSQGMLASERELGIGDDHSGIFILPDAAKVGSNVVELLQLNEPVLEIDITPNRPDCFSILGLAREVAALFGKKLHESRITVREQKGKTASSRIAVTLRDKTRCTKYGARVIEGVHVGASPLWLSNRLRQVGIRPINNVVDVTNYVMMELGHPLHAFDYDRLSPQSSSHPPTPSSGRREARKRIIVRPAAKGEQIHALDGNTYTLGNDTLVIADKDNPIAIAGIMGGEASSVTNETSTVVLEAAVFDGVAIRKTSRALGLRSESSSRFEKGVDRTAVEASLDRAASLIAELSGGSVLQGRVVAGTVSTPKPRRLVLPLAEVEQILGVRVQSAKSRSILQSLGFSVSGSDPLTVTLPTWRLSDVTISPDLVEEIGRMLDYNTLPKTLPVAPVASPELSPLETLRKNFRSVLIAAGYSELLSYSFYGSLGVELSGQPQTQHITLTNPVNKEYPYLRTSLEPWLAIKLSQNSSLLSRPSIKLFEFGKVFSRAGERWQLGVGMTDTEATAETLYRMLRGLARELVGPALVLQPKGDCFELLLGSTKVGQLAVYERNSLHQLRLRSRVGILLLEIEQLPVSSHTDRGIFKPLPYYPLVERDLAALVPATVHYRKIVEVITSFDPLIKEVALFDVYHGLEGGTSLAFRITFGSTDRTLESKEVDACLEKLQATLQKQFSVSFR